MTTSPTTPAAQTPAALDCRPLKTERDPAQLLQKTLADWHAGRRSGDDLWIFAYASLIWRPEFEFVEKRLATVHGWSRALEMWSRVNRGTPACPGLVFAMLPGGCCKGVAYRIKGSEAEASIAGMWPREMPTGVYDPRFVTARTQGTAVRALAFTLSKRSPNYTGKLSDARYRQILAESCGRYGTTLEYAQATLDSLRSADIEDAALARILSLRG